MTKAIVHNCSKDKVKPIIHKFKLKLNKRMREEVDLAWRKIWDDERKKLIDGLKKRKSTASQPGFVGIERRQVLQGVCSKGEGQGDAQGPIGSR